MRRYRVVCGNSVLEYYRSRKAAEAYLQELAIYSPDVYAKGPSIVEVFQWPDDKWVPLPEKGKS